MTNTCEPVINLVKDEQAKCTDKPEPKRCAARYVFQIKRTQVWMLPGKSWSLTHRVNLAEHDKPVLLPCKGQADREGGCWQCGYEIAEKANAIL